MRNSMRIIYCHHLQKRGMSDDVVGQLLFRVRYKRKFWCGGGGGRGGGLGKAPDLVYL